MTGTVLDRDSLRGALALVRRGHTGGDIVHLDARPERITITLIDTDGTVTATVDGVSDVTGRWTFAGIDLLRRLRVSRGPILLNSPADAEILQEVGAGTLMADVDAGDLAAAAKAAATASHREAVAIPLIREFSCGLLRIDGDTATVAGTDRFLASVSTIRSSVTADPPGHAVLPQRVLVVLAGLRHAGRVRISRTGPRWRFETDVVTIDLVESDIAYPDLTPATWWDAPTITTETTIRTTADAGGRIVFGHAVSASFGDGVLDKAGSLLGRGPVRVSICVETAGLPVRFERASPRNPTVTVWAMPGRTSPPLSPRTRS